MTSSIKQIIILLFAFSIFSLNGYSQTNKLPDPNKTSKKLAATMQIIRYAYVDSINEADLVENAIIETLKELDPHSSYISKEDLDAANEPLEGSFEGIGVTFQIYHDTILVVAPVPGGPSDKLGILAGDKIVKIDGEKSTGEDINNKFVFDHLRGKKGTEVNVSIFRKGKKELIEYTIVRDKIPLNSIDATFMATPEIGFIKLNRFSKTSIEEFKESLSNLKKQGMKKLILDLRGNSGGYLKTAVQLSDEFLQGGKLIVYTKGLRSSVQKFNSSSFGGFKKGQLIILINEGSASASEIVSGAIQDWDRGVVLGRRSFGKGLVQRPFELPDGSVVRLTTARYHTPTGRCIQRPYKNGVQEYYLDLYKRFTNGELENRDSIHFPDSLKYTTPKNRIVYGGGGIMPDIFVPWDSTTVTDYYTDIVRKGILNEFVMNYMDENRKKLTKKYPVLADFKNDFIIDDDFMIDFVEFAKEKGVDAKQDDYNKSEKFIKKQIKALIARNLWDSSAYFEIIYEIDDEYIKAIEILKDNSLYKKITKKSEFFYEIR
ncbi:MAG: S41 family peptidase [Bacteroidales bacterium]|nr:S41 family peptidase [Bacteroidales bacterium]